MKISFLDNIIIYYNKAAGNKPCVDFATNCQEAFQMHYCTAPEYITLMRWRCNQTCGYCGKGYCFVTTSTESCAVY